MKNSFLFAQPPQCSMKIVRNNGQEINSAEIGDNLMLQVEVQPASKFIFRNKASKR
jgi:hypothetical protein